MAFTVLSMSMWMLTVLVGLWQCCCSVGNPISGSSSGSSSDTQAVSNGNLSFPLYVGDNPQPLYMTYRESDLLSSSRMGAVCGEFVREHSGALGVALAEAEVAEAMMFNICQTAAQVISREQIKPFDKLDLDR